MHRFLLPILFSLSSSFLLAQSIVWITPCSNDTFCLNPGSCTEGNVFLTEKAVTNCSGGYVDYSYKIDLFNDGSINIQISDDTINQAFPVGTHKITWRANDNCGNVSQACSYLFTVKDCNPPNLLCINGLTQNLEFPECEATFEVDNFILNLQDNCTPFNELDIGMRVKGSGTGFPTDTSLTFGICEQGLHILEIFVRDENGLMNSCNSYVLVQDNSGLCPCNIDADLRLEGCARSADSARLDSYLIRVELEGQPPMAQPFDKTLQLNVSDSCFSALFPKLPLNGAYSGSVRARRLGDPLTGVSTFDLVTINKHILGQQLFTSFFQVLASDVNGSKTITTFDIIEIRKLILGIYDTFPQVPAWRFILPMPDTNLLDFAAVRDTYPFSVPDLLDDMTLTGFDFIGVKMGDANSSAMFQHVEDRGAPLSLEFENIWLEAGQTAWVPLRLAETVSLDGFQLALQADPNRLQIQNIRGIPPEFVALSESGELRIACTYDSPKAFALDMPFVLIGLEAREAGYLADVLRLNHAALAAEAYTQEVRAVRPLRLATVQGGATLFPPRPNPFAEKTIFELMLDTPQQVAIDLFDMTGRQVYRAEYTLEAGQHNLPVLGADLPNNGVWTYRVVVGAQVFAGRLMRL